MGNPLNGWRARLAQMQAEATAHIPADAQARSGLPALTPAEAQAPTEHVRPPAIPLHWRALLGIVQRVLEVLESAHSMPQDDPLVLFVTAAAPADLATETLSDTIAAASVLRFLHVSSDGSGITHVAIHHPSIAGGSRDIFINAGYLDEGGSSSSGFFCRVPAGAQIGLRMDNAIAGTTALTLTAVLTRESETATGFWRGRR